MSFMAQEAREAPQAAARFLQQHGQALADLGLQLRRLDPKLSLTCARGSSDHAAAYFKYVSEILTGVPCASVGASVVSVYGAKLKLQDALCVTISQSGKSPDIVALQEAASNAGALTLALVNVADSPVARNAHVSLALQAGSEVSVAATKSFIVSLVAAAAVVAYWQDDKPLIAAVQALPEVLEKACQINWPILTGVIARSHSLYVLGRGPAFPIAAETALKLKETCAVHAEAYSVAEVMHGPLELLGAGFPVLVYAPADQSAVFTAEAIQKMRATQAQVLVVGQGDLPVAATAHALLEPISMIQTAYLAIEAAAVALGRNPDMPRHLKKVTETV